MSINRRRFITIAAGASIAATSATSFAKPAVWRGIALGADAKLIIAGLADLDAKRLITLAVKEVNRLENIFSLHNASSEIAVLNEFGILKSPSTDLLSLMSIVDQIHKASEGYFDPTIQPLWATYAENGGKPSPVQIEHSLDLVDWGSVNFSTQDVRFENPKMAMTLNGIAQGFITDRVVHLLKNEGLQNAIVEMGEISAVGRNETGNPWEVGIANSGDEVADETLHLQDKSIATSSVNATTFDGNVGHILNPKHGKPTQSMWQRVSVIHKSAAIADGISTAASLMNEGQIENMLGQFRNVRLRGKHLNGNIYAHQC